MARRAGQTDKAKESDTKKRTNFTEAEAGCENREDSVSVSLSYLLDRLYSAGSY